MNWGVFCRAFPAAFMAMWVWGCGGSEPETSGSRPETSQELVQIGEALQADLAGDEDAGTTRSEGGGSEGGEEEEFFYPGQDLIATPEPTPTPTPEPQAVANFDRTPVVPEDLPNWSYEGETGPQQWATLGEACATCGEGQAQSPIDLTGAVEADLANPVFNYGMSNIHIVNNGYTIQVNVDPGSHLDLDGEKYGLLQFHMHAPAEHTIEGKQFQAEMHFVHRNVDGDIAIVAVMIRKGTKNEAYANAMKLVPADVDMEIEIEDPAQLATLLPESRTSYRYDGSLTTPPCTEGVKWIVMTEPVGLSIAQLQPFLELLEGNNRPQQAIGGRTIQLDTSP